MKPTLWAPIFLLAMLLTNSACSPFLKVYAEEEPGVNLYQYTTYSWLNTPATGQGNSGPEWQSQHTQGIIRGAVETQMGRFGFKFCEQNPDLILHYHVVVKNEVLFVRDQWCDEENWSRFGHCNRVRPVQYKEGMLILDFIDAKTGNQVWRGAAVAVQENLREAQADAQIQEAVRLIFGKFPQKAIPAITGFMR